MSRADTMPPRLTTVDHEILTVLRLECARTQGYLVNRTGRSRQQIHTRLQILAGSQILRAVHYPTALYEMIQDPREDEDEFPLVELNIVDRDGDEIGSEQIKIGPSGIPTSHQYQHYDSSP
ncbi:hypothetical protein [Halalkalicoccus salilacus]|uniref:hypothetical protein n=1 Tax=Halalkalicoccus salilacus TaxID=3117459 RepID=UPI00300E7DC3